MDGLMFFVIACWILSIYLLATTRWFWLHPAIMAAAALATEDVTWGGFGTFLGVVFMFWFMPWVLGVWISDNWGKGYIPPSGEGE